MYQLRIAHDWATQIQSIRNHITEDTNLIRFDNSFYRICRANADKFHIHLQPSQGHARGVNLVLRERDLYVMTINERPFEQYAKTLNMRAPQAQGLDHAILQLDQATGRELFELQSLIVLCVAESLRNDHIATRVEQMIRTTLIDTKNRGLIGGLSALPVPDLLQEAHAWGDTSEAIYQAISPQAQSIVLRPRAGLSGAERQFSERVDVARLPAALNQYAYGIKVLKRPAVH